MISARERTTDYGLARGGLQAAAEPLVVYASAGSHSCVEKGALLAGFGRRMSGWFRSTKPRECGRRR